MTKSIVSGVPVMKSAYDVGLTCGNLVLQGQEYGAAMLAAWPALAKDFASADVAGWKKFEAGARQTFDNTRKPVRIIRQNDGSYRHATADDADDAGELITAASCATITREAYAVMAKTVPTKYAIIRSVGAKVTDFLKNARARLKETVGAVVTGKPVKRGTRTIVQYLAETAGEMQKRVRAANAKAACSTQETEALNLALSNLIGLIRDMDKARKAPGRKAAKADKAAKPAKAKPAKAAKPAPAAEPAAPTS